MKLAWLTDIHLNFLEQYRRILFYEEIKDAEIDAVMITGDIGEANCSDYFLLEMQMTIQKPIYFVLGNHDFYNGSVRAVRSKMEKLNQISHDLVYLTNRSTQFFRLSNTASVLKTAILGVDGFADARNGNYKGTTIELNDSRYIHELSMERTRRCGMGMTDGDNDPVFEAMRLLADEDAKNLDEKIKCAINKRTAETEALQIIIATHVPPFEQLAFYRGKVSGQDFLPFYTSKATGDVLLAAAKANPNVIFNVYCGHSHGAANTMILPNLGGECGQADYMYPKIQKVIHV